MKAFGSVARRPVPEDLEPVAVRDPVASGHWATTAISPRSHALPHMNRSLVPEPAPAGPWERLREVGILVVDDCLLFRDSLASALAANGVRTVGHAWDATTLVSAICRHPRCVVLMNIATRDSAALLRAALAADPNVRVVVLGVSDDDESEIIACAEAGVAGYHTRTESFDDLLAMLAKVAAGESFCSPHVSAVLMRRLSTLAAARTPTAKELVLTTREAQILDMLRLGMSNRDIAENLCIAVHTVKNHVHSVLTKLGVGTRAEAVALAHVRCDTAN